jgi:polyisoprenoid-binding protein YceI
MTVAPETGLWRLDAAASTVTFRHRSPWGFGTVRGRLAPRDGRGRVRGDGSSVGAVILDAASLDTGCPRRDARLKGPAYFDVARHPDLTYTVTSADLHTDGTLHVIGRLTVRGTARPLALTADVVPSGADAVTLAARCCVDPGHFGMAPGVLGVAGGLTTVDMTLRFVRRGP